MAQARRTSDKQTVDARIACGNDGALIFESVGGHALARVGKGERHNVVKLALAGWRHGSLPPGCRVPDWVMTLQSTAPGDPSFYEPGVFVSFGPASLDHCIRSDAILAAGVLSPTTQRTDQRERFDACMPLNSPIEYVSVERDISRAEVVRHHTAWDREASHPDDTLQLDAIRDPIDNSLIYRSVVS